MDHDSNLAFLSLDFPDDLTVTVGDLGIGVCSLYVGGENSGYAEAVFAETKPGNMTYRLSFYTLSH